MPPTDLDYFYERVLDKTNIKDFYQSLPSHLQSRFNQCNHTKIIWGNVLQGYRGPSNMCNNGSGDSAELHSSGGIQEIKFWWGARKDLNSLVPLIGTVIFGAGRAKQILTDQLEWSSLYFDSKTGECLSHDKDEASEKLNERGCQLSKEGKYSEAAEYHLNAYRSCSSRYRNEQTFKNNFDQAESEIEAISLNSQGDSLFRQGEYTEAYRKYKEAYHKSQVYTQYDTYGTNRDKAQSEIDAMDLNSQGDHLFMQGNFTEAYSKYQEAYNKSQVTKEKRVYSINKDKTYINELSILHTLWNKAWDAEHDTENDRSGEAREIFKRVLSESKNNLKMFPENLRFKQYETLASLKIEGNELFNRGLESQQDATKCLQEAQELKQQQKFKLALIKYQEAKVKFTDAQKKFTIGSESDQRFVSCIEFVQEQLNEVIESIAITEAHSVNLGLNDLNINVGIDNLDANDYESNTLATNEQHNYYQQI